MKKPRDDEERDEIKMKFFFFTSQIGNDVAELIRVGPHESEKSTGDNRQIKSIEWAKKKVVYTLRSMQVPLAESETTTTIENNTKKMKSEIKIVPCHEWIPQYTTTTL